MSYILLYLYVPYAARTSGADARAAARPPLHHYDHFAPALVPACGVYASFSK